MDRYGRASEEGSRSDPSIQWTSHGVETSMGRLGLSGGGGGESYPERSDEPDCIYYLRTGGVAQCSHFAQHGICKFGPACKFNHSMSSSLSYSPSASSLTNMPVAPYPIVSSSNEPTTEAVTAAVSSPMVSGLSQQEPAETSCDSAIEGKASSS
ncbi:hypothetical protein F2Q68_00033135 [Brassica cretica]|uniref:C3H1-type domain-containing protein n=1 Tax=Brassica cretica TaxID=69181 RepID=A0A8S9GE32_BRACR|nr:hypothetical protein F2Q68_00033135 [Brassica cretica]